MASLGEDLLGIVNKLQDLVFNTIGNDSLDLPQIVRNPSLSPLSVILANSLSRWSLVRSPLGNLQSSRTSSVETFCRVGVGLLLEDRLSSNSSTSQMMTIPQKLTHPPRWPHNQNGPNSTTYQIEGLRNSKMSSGKSRTRQRG